MGDKFVVHWHGAIEAEDHEEATAKAWAEIVSQKEAFVVTVTNSKGKSWRVNLDEADKAGMEHRFLIFHETASAKRIPVQLFTGSYDALKAELCHLRGGDFHKLGYRKIKPEVLTVCDQILDARRRNQLHSIDNLCADDCETLGFLLLFSSQSAILGYGTNA